MIILPSPKSYDILKKKVFEGHLLVGILLYSVGFEFLALHISFTENIYYNKMSELWVPTITTELMGLPKVV